jgi:hypothetical protein
MNGSKQAGMARKAIIVVWLVALALAPFPSRRSAAASKGS